MGPASDGVLPSVSRSGQGPLYATFPRRLNALTIDGLILVCWSMAVLTVGATLEHSTTARGVAFVLWVIVALGYEPFMVSRLGGTLGHVAMNLCVCDNETGGRVPFPRAVFRTVIKAVLGIGSFFTMNFSSRHQAIHDILTGSSVRIRDVARAKPHQYWTRPAGQREAVQTGQRRREG